MQNKFWICLILVVIATGNIWTQDTAYHAKGAYVSDVLPASSPPDDITALVLTAREATEFISNADPAGGFVWEQKFSGAGWVFEDISFGDAQSGFAVAELGKVLRTQDGGETWQTVLNLGFPYYWYGVQAFDADRVIISGFNNQTGDGILRWTYDGGDTWSNDVILLGDPGSIRWLNRIQFAGDLHGITTTLSLGGIHRTATGGATPDDWTFRQVDPSRGWLNGNFTYMPDGNAWVSGISFCHTADHGVNWDCRRSIDDVFDGGGAAFPDAQHGWVGGGSISPEVRGWVHRTTDGAETWSGRILQAPFPIRALLFLDANVGFAVGGNLYTGVGGIYSTRDGGDTWHLDVNTGAEMKGLTSVWVSEGVVDLWCAGFDGSFTGKIYKAQWTRP